MKLEIIEEALEQAEDTKEVCYFSRHPSACRLPLAHSRCQVPLSRLSQGTLGCQLLSSSAAAFLGSVGSLNIYS